MKNVRLPHWLATGAAFLSVAIGVFVLVTWELGRWRIATLGADYIPMAPVTALLFVALGMVLGGRLLLPKTRRTETVALITIGLVALTCVLDLVRARLSFHLPWDLWGFGVETKYNMTEIGRMAPTTAISFLLAAAALVAEHPAFHRYRSFQWIGRKLSAAGMLLAGVVLFAYAAGEPLGYGPQSVPMALLTAVAFLILQTGALLVSKANARASAEATAPADSLYFRGGVTVAIVVMLAGCFYGGYAMLQSRQNSMRKTVQDQLQSIAELKAREILQWRRERIGDALMAAATPGLAEFLAQLAENPAGGGPDRAKIETFFASVLQIYTYPHIVLLDRTLSPVLVVPAQAQWDGILSPATRRSLGTTRSVLIEDIHRTRDGHTNMDMIAPVRRPGSDTIAGAVVLTIDAEKQLYPMIRVWPTPSASAETLLVRREGAEIVYLNELLHQPNPALRLRFPLTDQKLLAAQALGEGKYGQLEGVDYHGQAVLGYSLRLSGSDWVLIAKIDREEAYEEIYQEGRQIFLGIGLLGAIGLLFLRSWSQYRHHRQMETQLTAERAARSANERLAMIMRHANDGLVLYDETQHIIEANDRAAALYGYSLPEMRQMTAAQLRANTERDSVDRDFAQVIATTGIFFETKHQRKDGTVFPVEVSSRAIVDGDNRVVLSVIRDISERRAHEGEIERVTRLYQVISKINQALVRSKSRDELFTAVCRVLVETGQFLIAWVGWVDPATNTIRPVTVAGDPHGYVPGLTIPLNPALAEGRGPSATAFRAGRTYVCNDYFADPATLPWREKAAGSGFQSAMSLPFTCQGQPTGLLTVYAAEAHFFTAREIQLLEETARDVSFALDVFAIEKRELEATAELRESEARFRDLFDLESDAILLLDADSGRIIEANQAACTLYGGTAAELESLRNVDISAEPEETLATARPENRKLGSVILIPHRQHRKRNGTLFPVEISLRFFERANRTYYLAAIRDITLQVTARDTLLRFNAELEGRVLQRTLELATRTKQIEALLRAIPDTVIRLRTDGAVLHTQPAKDSPALAALTPAEGIGPTEAIATGLIAESLRLGQQALAEAAAISREAEISTPGGPLAVELRTAPVGDDEFVIFARDISARKRHEAESAALLQKERAVSEMKTRFQ